VPPYCMRRLCLCMHGIGGAYVRTTGDRQTVNTWSSRQLLLFTVRSCGEECLVLSAPFVLPTYLRSDKRIDSDKKERDSAYLFMAHPTTVSQTQPSRTFFSCSLDSTPLIWEATLRMQKDHIVLSEPIPKAPSTNSATTRMHHRRHHSAVIKTLTTSN
jgi:hypothetical protein